MRFPSSKERWAKQRANEHVYAITKNNQKGALVEAPLPPREVAKREAARRKKDAAVARTIAGQGEQISEAYEGIQDHLEEIASGALVAGRDGPERIEFYRPEVDEVTQLEADYAKARRQEDPVAMARTKNRLAAVREAEQAKTRELELARVVNDPASYYAVNREAIEDELDDVWQVTGNDGITYEFDDEYEATEFQKEVNEELEASDWDWDEEDEEDDA
jgi:hypothetical protein